MERPKLETLMKRLSLLALAFYPLVSISQDAGMPSMEAPAEMQSMAYLVGKWKGKMTMQMMGDTELEASMITEMVLGGRYVRSMHAYTFPGMGELTGMHIRTYDAAAKTWRSWWFDSTSPVAMVMTGNTDGKTMVSVSSPTEMPGMGTIVMRETFTKVSDTEITTKLEMKEGDGWSPAFTISYTKQ